MFRDAVADKEKDMSSHGAVKAGRVSVWKTVDGPGKRSLSAMSVSIDAMACFAIMWTPSTCCSEAGENRYGECSTCSCASTRTWLQSIWTLYQIYVVVEAYQTTMNAKVA